MPSGDFFTGNVSAFRLGPGREELPAPQPGVPDPFAVEGAVSATIDIESDDEGLSFCNSENCEHFPALTKATGSVVVNAKGAGNAALFEQILGSTRDLTEHRIQLRLKGDRLFSCPVHFVGRRQSITPGRLVQMTLQFRSLGRPVYYAITKEITIKALPPGSPGLQKATAVNHGIILIWADSVENGARVDGYEVAYKEEKGDSLSVQGWQEVTIVQGNGTLVGGLVNGTEYRFRVVALSVAGRSNPSFAVGTPEPQQSPPGPPTEVAGVSSDSTVEVTWVNSVEAQYEGFETEVTKILIRNRPVTSTSWTSHYLDNPVTQYRLSGLPNGITQDIQVRGGNEVGYGPAASIQATPQREITPLQFTAYTLSVASSLTVNIDWTAAVADPVEVVEVTSIEAIVYVSGSETSRVTHSDPSKWKAGRLGVPNLTAGVVHEIILRLGWRTADPEVATVTGYTEPGSAFTTSITPYGSPSFAAGAALGVVLTPKQGTQDTGVSIQVPAMSDNGRVLQSIVVERLIQGGSWERVRTITGNNISLDPTSYALEDLDDQYGKTVQFRITPHNGFQGAALVSAPVSVPINPPNPVTNLSVSSATRHLVINWSAAVRGSENIASYTWFFQREGEDPSAPRTANTTSAEVRNPDYNYTYTISVTAVTANSRSSAVTTTAVKLSPAPVTPSGLTVVRREDNPASGVLGDRMSVAIGVSPADTTEHEITGHTVYRVPVDALPTDVTQDESIATSPRPVFPSNSLGGDFRVLADKAYWIGVAAVFRRKKGATLLDDSEETSPSWIYVKEGAWPAVTPADAGATFTIAVEQENSVDVPVLTFDATPASKDFAIHVLPHRLPTGNPSPEELLALSATAASPMRLSQENIPGLRSDSLHSVALSTYVGSDLESITVKHMTVGTVLDIELNPPQALSATVFEHGATLQWQNPTALGDAEGMVLEIFQGSSTTPTATIDSFTIDMSNTQGYVHQFTDRTYNTQFTAKIFTNKAAFRSKETTDTQVTFTTAAPTPPDPTATLARTTNDANGQITFTATWSHTWVHPLSATLSKTGYDVRLLADGVELQSLKATGLSRSQQFSPVHRASTAVRGKAITAEVTACRGAISGGNVVDASVMNSDPAASSAINVPDVVAVAPTSIITSGGSSNWQVQVAWGAQPEPVHSLQVDYKLNTDTIWTTQTVTASTSVLLPQKGGSYSISADRPAPGTYDFRARVALLDASSLLSPYFSVQLAVADNTTPSWSSNRPYWQVILQPTHYSSRVWSAMFLLDYTVVLARGERLGAAMSRGDLSGTPSVTLVGSTITDLKGLGYLSISNPAGQNDRIELTASDITGTADLNLRFFVIKSSTEEIIWSKSSPVYSFKPVFPPARLRWSARNGNFYVNVSEPKSVPFSSPPTGFVLRVFENDSEGNRGAQIGPDVTQTGVGNRVWTGFSGHLQAAGSSYSVNGTYHVMIHPDSAAGEGWPTTKKIVNRASV